ncbi:Pentatricopeptide repeat-containing protein, partial [Cucurbita argyrosperma subsp. argyrosperma]
MKNGLSVLVILIMQLKTKLFYQMFVYIVKRRVKGPTKFGGFDTWKIVDDLEVFIKKFKTKQAKDGKLKADNFDAYYDSGWSRELGELYEKRKLGVLRIRVDRARFKEEVFDGMMEKNLVYWWTMISGYARMGNLEEARHLFENMPMRNVVSWNAMIAGYAQNENYADAIELFRQMQREGDPAPNDVTLVSVLSACARLGALDIDGDEAFKCFDEMIEDDGLKPNDISFMALLTACTHAGLVDKGLKYFDMMAAVYGITPKVEHYGCVVDLLSRVGRLNQAESWINSMPVQPNVIVWGALLAGCRIYKDAEREENVIAVYLGAVGEGDDGAYNKTSEVALLKRSGFCRCDQ